MQKLIMVAALAVSVAGFVTACDKAENTTPIAPAQSAKEAEVSASESLDGRMRLPLNEEQRQHVLEEMRGLLLATQGVVEGLAREDMDMVAASASSVGMDAMHTVENQENMKRLRMRETAPKEFMMLGMGVHKAFDEMAQMAADNAPPKDIQLKLAETMNNCMACHSSYQIPNP